MPRRFHPRNCFSCTGEDMLVALATALHIIQFHFSFVATATNPFYKSIQVRCNTVPLVHQCHRKTDTKKYPLTYLFKISYVKRKT
jgi:Na+/serine symporter